MGANQGTVNYHYLHAYRHYIAYLTFTLLWDNTGSVKKKKPYKDLNRCSFRNTIEKKMSETQLYTTFRLFTTLLSSKEI